MIRVNDRDEVDWQEGLTVAQLLQVCRFTSPKIAVFVEDELIRREDYGHHLIPDGAAVKVLHLIGGG